MGAINSAFTQAVGSVAAAAYGLKRTAETDIEQGLHAKEGAVRLGEEIPEIQAQGEAAKAKLAAVQKDEEALGEIADTLDPSNTEDAQAFAELNEDVKKDRKMAELAIATVKAKMIAREELMQRFEQQIAKANRWGGKK